ncbi:DNA excision repair protein ERCC-6 [Halyomorpha halys]|uniref:DNA excision repair protein ERCC-6 n=1 Tax=Halyomorpha halys TaxID=286706 RepID=UPI0006D50CED|nr:DNA excision repair protein ERCC-6-like [Halyomorpha halys]
MEPMELDENEIAEKPSSKFNVDISAIESVERDKQAFELQSLEISVFDQSTFEKGVIQQVGKALTGDAEHFFKSEDLNANELENGDPDDSQSPAREEPPALANKSTKQNKSLALDPVSKIEEYLRTQAKLQESRKILPKKKNTELIKPPSSLEKKIPKINKKNEKKEIKSHFLGPTKRKKKKQEKLGCRSGRSKFDSPGTQPGEENYIYLNDSGSEYLPSDDSASSFEFERSPPKKSKLGTGPRKKRTSIDIHNLSSDESDWQSDEEEVSKRRTKKEADDGDAEFYCKRIKTNRINKYEMATVEIDEDFIIPKDIWEKLYEYQKEAVKWFWDLNQKQCGGILGDEMGLGKTVQMIAFLAALDRSELTDRYTRYKGLGPTLIVCPTTVMHQWVREFHKWYPPLRVAILHESGTYGGKDRKKLINSVHCDPWGVIITSYSGLVQHQDSIISRQWHYVILDEGHKIRNPKAKVTIAAKEIDTPNRIILSGSPLQNNLQELWSLIDFVYPDKLGSLQMFMETLAVPIVQGGYANASQTQVVTAHKCATILKDTITPYLLRRMKEDVGCHINLPEKKEQVLFCKLTDDQRELYKNYIENIDVDEVLRGKAKIFVPLINLRKICNHPDLYSGGPQRNFRISSGDGPAKENHFGYWERAGKMIVIETLLKIWKEQGHRVLIFTQGKKMLMIMENFIKRSNYKYLRLDGSTSISSRQPLIDKFNKDITYFVMLLTTRVGGLGVNLTGANRVVIYDPDWNPATDSQARERAWRIGQEKDVTIYRLITAGTIEEKIYHRQIFKQFLSNRVLKDPRQRRFFKSNDLMELFTLTETVKNGTTETAAIFAGTGSEVTEKKLESKIKKTIPKKKSESNNEEITFSQSKIEQMKKLAQLISKKLSEKNHVDKRADRRQAEDHNKKTDCSNVEVEKILKEENIYGPDGSINVSSAAKVIASQKEVHNYSSPSANCISNPVSVKETACDTKEVETFSSVDSSSNKNHEKKKKSIKKSIDNFATFDGRVVPHLIKKRRYKKDKQDEVKEKYISQDDYVLKKLFSKGIDSALLHDKIVEDGPSDFAIVEAEAEKVARDALKTLRESRTGPSRFSIPSKNDKKPGEKPSLLEIIKKRNMMLESSNSDQILLSDMISWMQEQGGTSPTDNIVQKFRLRVGPGKSPLFKKLLESIATFYRGPDKVGYWTLRPEFNSSSTSQ